MTKVKRNGRNASKQYYIILYDTNIYGMAEEEMAS
jgi:hypothetical protein